MEILRIFAFVLDPSDNVATVLTDVESGDSVILKGASASISAAEYISFGHKIALCAIRSGEDIIKYGEKIGIATADIHPGAWVHLHNMASALDAGFLKRLEQ
jgi:altronate dehydratase